MTSPTTSPPAADPGLTAGQVVDLVAIVMAYRAATDAIRAQLGGMVTGLWLSLGQYRDQQRKQFTADVVPYVQAAAAQMSSLTAGYLAAAQQQQTGRLVTPPAIRPPDLTALRNGTDPAEVYGRPFHLVWRQLAELPHEDGAIEQAIDAGMKRAEKTAFTDLQLAKRHTSQASLSTDRYAIGWRRVLEGAHSCGLCIVASTNRYHKRQLMPIHPGCDCGVVPVYVDSDAAEKANRQLIGDVHQAIADRFGSSDYAAREIPGAKDGNGDPLLYRHVLITHEHGELGPVLAVKGRPFTGPADLTSTKRTRTRTRTGRTPEQVQAELTSLQRSLPGLSDPRQRAYHETRIASLQQQLV